ncbi:MAG: GGDEF domain-containing protein, partial [Desulfocapsa sp.]|nr:GGDEF domain-containing protein [Desulfocapsa sp.]
NFPKFPKYFLSILLPWAIALFIFFAYFYLSQAAKLDSLVLEREHLNIRMGQRAIHQEFQTVMSDVLYLAKHSVFQNNKLFLSTDDRQDLQSDFVRFAEIKGVYDQVRFLDVKGQEVIRVNYSQRKAHPVSKDLLQNKSSRYYFYESLKTDRSMVYVSPLDLNKENGEIEKPHKPMIRFGTPVFNAQGEEIGVLLLNYLAERLLDNFSNAVANIDDHISIVNDEGYWLKHPQPDKEWGFMFNKTNNNIKSSHPAEWEKILAEESGQFRNKEGIFTFTTIHLFQALQLNTELGTTEKQYSTENEYSWKAVSHITSNMIKTESKSRLMTLVNIITPVFLLVMLFSWRLARARIKSEEDENLLKHQATIDTLTNLPNRHLFNDRLSRCLLHSNRLKSQFALLFIDLDRFKKVNDTLGHAAGDQLLQQVADRLQQIIRESDTVARIGGDEFTIILNAISKSSDVVRVAQLIVEILSEPFFLNEEQANIGASVGIAIYPQDATEITNLMQNADTAMYQAKENGRNCYCFFDTL